MSGPFLVDAVEMKCTEVQTNRYIVIGDET